MKKGASVFWLVIGVFVIAGVAVTQFWNTPSAMSRDTAPSPAIMELRTAEGSITGIDKAAARPVLKFTASDGRELELALDPISTVILQDRKATSMAQLERGQRIKASYQNKGGQEVANSIEILDPMPMPAATDGPPAAIPAPGPGS